MTNEEFLARVRKMSSLACDLRCEMEEFQEEYEKENEGCDAERLEDLSCEIEDKLSAVSEFEDYVFYLWENMELESNKEE